MKTRILAAVLLLSVSVTVATIGLLKAENTSACLSLLATTDGDKDKDKDKPGKDNPGRDDSKGGGGGGTKGHGGADRPDPKGPNT